MAKKKGKKGKKGVRRGGKSEVETEQERENEGREMDLELNKKYLLNYTDMFAIPKTKFYPHPTQHHYGS